MKSPEENLSRREWLERVSVPALVATAGSVLVASSASGAEPAGNDASLATNAGARVYNVRDFGAKGDGTTLDTAAIQAAIDACTGDRGGTVLLPAGDFLSGTLELKSNVTLHLAAQGRLLGSKDREHYLNRDTMIARGVSPGNGNVVLLFAAKARNVTIEGRGTIDGQGGAFYTGVGDGTAPAAVRSQDPGASQPNRDRPHLMIYENCENFRMRGVFLTASAYHCSRILRCKHVQLEGVRIYNRVNLNNDGFHFNSCEYVQVSNCEIRCQDDACALFGSNKFVTINNCAFSTRWSVFRFGSGEAQNITVSNCLIYETYGCPIKISSGRGSRIENLSFSNLVMKNVTGPIGIGFSEGESNRPAGDGPKPFVRNISFNHIRASVVPAPVQHADMPFGPKIYDGEQNSCLTLNGSGGAWLENISLNDVHITYAGGGTAEQAAKREVPRMAAEYFGVWNKAPFGPPAYGLYARNVRGLTLQNVRFEFEQPDVRPAVVFENVRDAVIGGLSVQGNPDAESAVRLVNSRDVLFSSPRLLSPAAVFLQVEGADNGSITIDGGDVTKAAKALKAVRGAAAKAVRVRV